MDQGWRSYWAEFLGTFTLCFVGQGAICANQMMGGGSGLLGVAFAHGLALAVMITALASHSGAHFNPAVTFGFLLTGRQTLSSAARYWVSQLLGAVAASYLLAACFPPPVWQAVGLGAPALGPGTSVAVGLLVELLLTAFLVTAIWGTAVDQGASRVAGFVIGLAVTMDILIGGPLTGAAMNPARAFGAAWVAKAWDTHWLWWVAPLLGGGAAAAVYQRVMLGGRQG